MSDLRNDPPRRAWYSGMNPTLAFVFLGAVFLLLVTLMLARNSGDDKSSAKEVLNRPGPASQQK